MAMDGRVALDERLLIEQLEGADTTRLATLLANPTPEQERTLRAYLGDGPYGRMRASAVGQSRGRARAGARGNVMVLHGIMGGELTLFESDAHRTPIWVRVLRLLAGAFTRLGLDARGKSVERVEATGILKRYYGEQLLALQGAGWRTHAFWYDWRLDIQESAARLARRIAECFGDEPVHLVAHSMGGLVCRAFIRDNRPLWDSWWQGKGARGGRLIMLGTPNHGSFRIPQLLTGLNDVLRAVALLDFENSREELVRIAASFDGVFQMLPSPLVLPQVAKLYDSRLYEVPIDGRRFDLARRFHERLADVVDRERMVYVAGSGQPTSVGVKSYDREGLRSLAGYDVSTAGDGTVPHQLGRLSDAGGGQVDTYYVAADHQDLPVDARVVGAMDDLLTQGRTERLSRTPLGTRAGREAAAHDPAAAAQLLRQRARFEEEVNRRRQGLRVARDRGGVAERDTPVSRDEAALMDLLYRGSAAPASEAPVVAEVGSSPPAGPPVSPLGARRAPAPGLRVQFLSADLGGVGVEVVPPGPPAVDAIAVGHYIGVRPAAAELALDIALSGGPETPEDQRLLTNFTERRIIRGDLGQPFFLEDARPGPPGARLPSRLVAIAGMGHPGRFGAPELVLLVRELLWSLGRLGRRHLAAVLIGSGKGNLSSDLAGSIVRSARSWLEGACQALSRSELDMKKHVEVITIVDNDPERLLRTEEAFREQAGDFRGSGVAIEVVGLPDQVRRDLRKAAATKARERALASLVPAPRDGHLRREEEEDAIRGKHPSRMTLDLEGDQYRFGAVTKDASIPERVVPVDPGLVGQVNRELMQAETRELQQRRGEFLYRLVFPGEFHEVLASPDPLVITCDATVARIHWEMLARPSPPAGDGIGGAEARFISRERSLTRQLRTVFAPPPEPPPPPSRVLRVLIVGDTDADQPLPGAQAEAMQVKERFEALSSERPGTVEVRALIGPGEATRARVMEELIMSRYDVFHFAGHCVYDEAQRARSGLLFTGGERLSANELSRVDRAPGLVFCNACESGITPDRSDRSSSALAPTFAEAFFARGVQNFVCTGWPVDDRAALTFAEVFYRRLLGLPAPDQTNGDRRGARAAPEPIHLALLEARRAVAAMQEGLRTWGAYQHYGNPYFTLIEAATAAPVVALPSGQRGARKPEAARAVRMRRSSPRRGAAPRK
jgi:pimeloyl-ACP methyl ester carboxylesterase